MNNPYNLLFLWCNYINALPHICSGMNIVTPCQPLVAPQVALPKQDQASPAVSNTQKDSSQVIVYEKTVNKTSIKHSKKTSDFTAKLTKEDLDTIIAEYGTDIQDIYELGPGQKWMFSKDKVTSTFFTQTMFKAIAQIKPSAFRINTDKVVEKHDNLRTAFAHSNLKQPYQVVLKSRHADILFQDISNIAEDEIDEVLKRYMAADRRRGFDLERDVLLRISVYKTPNIEGKDACAVIISQPHINIDGVSSGILYKELFIDYAMKENGLDIQEDPDVAFKSYIDWLTTLDKTKEFDYWKEYLKDLPKLKSVPGYKKSKLEYVQATSALEFDEALTKKIRSLQRKCKATLNNVIQAAWGVMLQSLLDTDDVTFGAITSGRSAEVAGSAMIMGGMVNVLPVRVKEDKETSFIEVVSKMQKQFAESMTNSHCSPFEIQTELNRDEQIFDHLLNFHNFVGAGAFSQTPLVEGITMVGTESFDNLASDLCVYFGNVMGLFQGSFTYNANAFTSKKIDLLKNSFASVIRQICENPSIKVGEIKTDTLEVFRQADRDAEVEKKNLAAFLKSVKAFKGLPDEALDNLADYAKEESYIMDDVIVKDGKSLDKLMFIRDGFVELSRATMHGWYNPVKIYKKGNAITPEAMFENKKSSGVYIATSSNVTIVSFSENVMMEFIKRYPAISLNLAEELNSQFKSIATLWLNADV